MPAKPNSQALNDWLAVKVANEQFHYGATSEPTAINSGPAVDGASADPASAPCDSAASAAGHAAEAPPTGSRTAGKRKAPPDEPRRLPHQDHKRQALHETS